MLAPPYTPPAEVLPTAPQSSAKGNSWTRTPQTTMVPVEKSLRTLQADRHPARSAAPSPPTSPVVTEFPARFVALQFAMRTFPRVEHGQFFSKLLAYLFSRDAQVPFTILKCV